VIKKNDFFKLIDYSCLGWICPKETVKKYCEEVIKYGFASVCVNPDPVAYCASLIEGRAGISCVVGFPCGANSTRTKIMEGLEAVDNGATDLDFVTNFSMLRDKRDQYLLKEYKMFVDTIKEKKPETIIKIIMYTPYGVDSYLTDDEIKRVSELIVKSGADYIKFACDPAIIKKIVGNQIKLKFSGATTFELAIDAAEKGCGRIGVDNVLLSWLKERGSKYLIDD